MTQNNIIPEDLKTKPGIRHLRAITLLIGKQIQLSRDVAKKGGSFKEATAVRANQDPEFIKKVKAIWDGKA